MRLASGCLTVAFSVGIVAGAAAQDAKVQQGLKVYETQKCAICHSVAGKGNKKLPLDGAGKKLTEAQIREWIVAPTAAATKAKSTAKPAMRAYPNLPPADLEALVAYIVSLK
jgi:mono/diheme cytochrome c family protein